MLSEYKTEDYLPCDIEEINDEYFISNISIKPSDSNIITNSPITVITCTNGFAVINKSNIYYTYDKKSIDLLAKCQRGVNISEVSDEQLIILKNFLYYNICSISSESYQNNIRFITWPDKYIKKIDFNKQGWFSSIPLLLEIDVSKKCNLHCIYCHQNSSITDSHPNNAINKILKWGLEASKIGVPAIRLMGGEPFLLPGLLDICEQLKDSGIIIFQVSTNGTLIDKHNASKIANIFGQIQISLDSPYENLHDKIVNRKGTYKKVLKSVKLLTQNGASVLLNFVVMQNNINQIKDFAEFAYSIGADVRYLALFRGGRADSLTQLSKNELEYASSEILSIKEKYDEKMSINHAGFPVKKKISNIATFYGCQAGKNIIKLSTYNNVVYPCTRDNGLDLNTDNLNLIDIWYHDYFNKYREQPKCNCDYKNICGGPCIVNAKQISTL